MTVLTIGVARKSWLTMVTPDTIPEDLSHETAHFDPGGQVIFLGFEDDSLLVEKMISSKALANVNLHTTPALTGTPRNSVDQFIRTNRQGSFRHGSRVVIPYDAGDFMAALWGIGAAWKATFLVEWELLLEKTTINAIFSSYPMGRLLNQVFQTKLGNDTAPHVGDALQKILTLSQAYDAAQAAQVALAPFETYDWNS